VETQPDSSQIRPWETGGRKIVIPTPRRYGVALRKGPHSGRGGGAARHLTIRGRFLSIMEGGARKAEKKKMVRGGMDRKKVTRLTSERRLRGEKNRILPKLS